MLAVIGLVIALVIVNSSRQQTVVAPLPSLPEPSFPRPQRPRAHHDVAHPTIPVLPLPTLPTHRRRPPDDHRRAPTETVVYDVIGDGRAINITYVDTGGVLQTEFNVMLPWSKKCQLSEPAEGSASISIINVGREVNCSITDQRRCGAGAHRRGPDHLHRDGLTHRRPWRGTRHRQHRQQPGRQHHAQPTHAARSVPKRR